MEEEEPTERYGRSMMLQKGKEFLLPQWKRHACLLKNVTINLIIERRLQLQIIKKNSTKNIIIETNVRAIDTKYYNEYNN